LEEGQQMLRWPWAHLLKGDALVAWLHVGDPLMTDSQVQAFLLLGAFRRLEISQEIFRAFPADLPVQRNPAHSRRSL